MKQKIILLWAIFFISTAILLGAFGAHALKNVLSVNNLQSFETGIRYQIYHGLALLVLGIFSDHVKYEFKSTIYLLIVGIVLFSFSIYGLALQEKLGISLSWLGPITPIGGSLLITGWVVLGFKVWRSA